MKSFLGRSRRSGLQRESPQDACPLGSSKRRRARTCVSLPAARHTGYTRAKVHACVPLLKHKRDGHAPALESTLPVAQRGVFQATRPLSTGQDCAAITVRGRARGLHSSPPPPRPPEQHRSPDDPAGSQQSFLAWGQGGSRRWRFVGVTRDLHGLICRMGVTHLFLHMCCHGLLRSGNKDPAPEGRPGMEDE